MIMELEECVCGDCRHCRRALGEYTKPAPAQPPVELSLTTRRILAEGAYWEPPARVPTPRAAKAIPAPRKPRRRSSVAIPARERQARLAAQRKATRAEIDGFWHQLDPGCTHGTLSGYRHWYCRCEPCRGEHSKDLQAVRARKKARQLETTA